MLEAMSIFEHPINTLSGEPASLADREGQVLLLVNVASQCGLTPQYTALQQSYDRYADRGFEVLGFPCNQFAGQEPGSDVDVKSFCETKFGVTFPMFSKLDVNGAGRAPLYAWLTTQPTKPDGPGDIAWNFAKFVVGKDGRVRARFNPRVEATAPEVRSAIESALAE